MTEATRLQIALAVADKHAKQPLHKPTTDAMLRAAERALLDYHLKKGRAILARIDKREALRRQAV